MKALKIVFLRVPHKKIRILGIWDGFYIKYASNKIKDDMADHLKKIWYPLKTAHLYDTNGH